jgi:hypothetical protein
VQRFLRVGIWIQRWLALGLFGALLTLCIIKGWVAGGILSAVGLAAAVFVLYVRLIYAARIARREASPVIAERAIDSGREQ